MFTGPPDVEALQAKRDIVGLLDALRYAEDPAVPRSAADALLAIGVIPTLTILHGDIPPVLARALPDAGPRQLIAATREVDEARRLSLLQALVRTGDRRIAAVLHACLRDESPLVRRQAAVHLRVLNNHNSAFALAGALSDEPSVCWQTIKSLRGLCYNDERVQFQEIFLNGKDPEARAIAARALGAIGDDSCVRTLMEGVETAGKRLRQTILIWLGRSGNRSVAGPVLHVLNQAIIFGDVETMVEAILALGRLGDPRALDSIEALRKYSHPVIHLAAEGALRGIRGWDWPR